MNNKEKPIVKAGDVLIFNKSGGNVTTGFPLKTPLTVIEYISKEDRHSKSDVILSNGARVRLYSSDEYDKQYRYEDMWEFYTSQVNNTYSIY